MNVTSADIDVFLANQQARFDTQVHTFPRTHSAKINKKYARIIRTGHNHEGVEIENSVIAFIDMATGDIYKAASYRAPAPGIRGNIFSSDLDKIMTIYGVGSAR